MVDLGYVHDQAPRLHLSNKAIFLKFTGNPVNNDGIELSTFSVCVYNLKQLMQDKMAMKLTKFEWLTVGEDPLDGEARFSNADSCTADSLALGTAKSSLFPMAASYFFCLLPSLPSTASLSLGILFLIEL